MKAIELLACTGAGGFSTRAAIAIGELSCLIPELIEALDSKGRSNSLFDRAPTYAPRACYLSV